MCGERETTVFMKATPLMSTYNQLCYKLYNYHVSETNGVLAETLQVGRWSTRITIIKRTWREELHFCL